MKTKAQLEKEVDNLKGNFKISILLIIAISIMLFLVYVYNHAYDNFSKECDEIEEAFESCHMEFVTTSPPERKGMATCVCADRFFSSYEGKTRIEEIDLSDNFWFKARTFMS